MILIFQIRERLPMKQLTKGKLTLMSADFLVQIDRFEKFKIMVVLLDLIMEKNDFEKLAS